MIKRKITENEFNKILELKDTMPMISRFSEHRRLRDVESIRYDYADGTVLVAEIHIDANCYCCTKIFKYGLHTTGSYIKSEAWVYEK